MLHEAKTKTQVENSGCIIIKRAMDCNRLYFILIQNAILAYSLRAARVLAGHTGATFRFARVVLPLKSGGYRAMSHVGQKP